MLYIHRHGPLLIPVINSFSRVSSSLISVIFNVFWMTIANVALTIFTYK